MGHSLQISSQDHVVGRGAGSGRGGNAVAWGLVVRNPGDDERAPLALAPARRPEPVDPGGFSM